MSDDERVTMPFKFVTGAPPCNTTNPQHPNERLLTSTTSWLRRPLPEPEPDEALLAKLRRLPQVHQRQGRGL